MAGPGMPDVRANARNTVFCTPGSERALEVDNRLSSEVRVGDIAFWDGIALDVEMRRLLACLAGSLSRPIPGEIAETDVVRHLLVGTYTASLLVCCDNDTRAMAVHVLTEPKWESFEGVSLNELLSVAALKALNLKHDLLGTEHLLWSLLQNKHAPILSVLKRCAAIARDKKASTEDRRTTDQYSPQHVIGHLDSFLTHPLYPFIWPEYYAAKGDSPNDMLRQPYVMLNFMIRHLARRETAV